MLARLNISEEHAARLRRGLDPVEEEAAFEYYGRMVGLGVPQQALAAKFERDGELEGTLELYAQLFEFRKYFGPPENATAGQQVQPEQDSDAVQAPDEGRQETEGDDELPTADALTEG